MKGLLEKPDKPHIHPNRDICFMRTSNSVTSHTWQITFEIPEQMAPLTAKLTYCNKQIESDC